MEPTALSASKTWWAEPFHDFQSAKGDSEWIVRREIGSGASATVLHVASAEREYALKLYRPEFCVGDNAAVEQRRLRLQQSLIGHDCSTLVQVYEVGELHQSAYVLMEYIPWQSLDKLIGAVPRERIPILMHSLASAAKWLHEKRFVHRDIKPANVLVAPDYCEARLVDLGVLRLDDNDEADMTDQGVRRPFIATAQYSSPEYLFRLVEPSPDLWLGLTFYQLGGVLHDLLMRQPLFGPQIATANKYVLAMAVHSQMPIVEAADVSPKFVALAKRCLEKNLQLRLARVRWEDFLNADSFDANAARARLRLGATATRDLSKDLERVRESQSLLLKNVCVKLRDCVVNIAGTEGYPRTQWIDVAGGETSFLIAPATAGSKGARLQGTFSTQYHPTQPDRVDIFLEFSLVSGAGGARDPDSRPIWTGGIDQFESSIQSDLRSLIADELLRAYSKADDLLTAQPDVDIPTRIN